MRMRKNQEGFTIVELLIAVTILSIVVAAVCGFILVGSRSYAAGNSDISIQQEAQLALNQMSDVMIDTTRSVNYVGYDASGSPQKALKDAEFTFTPEDKSLIMYNGVVEVTAPAAPGATPSKAVDPGNGNKHYHFYWSKDAETLYYAELDVQSTDVDTTSIHFPVFDPADPIGAGWVVLAGHVTDFSVDLSQVEEKRVVQLALTFVDGTKEYVTSNNVTIRNKVGVNDAELDPLNKRKTLSITPRDSGVIIEPGEQYHFSTPKVTGENVTDRSVTWSLAIPGGNSPSKGTQFTDVDNGILQVATDEPAGSLDVVITTNAVDDDGNHASCTLSVDIKRVTAVNLAVSNPVGTEINALGQTVYLVSPGCEYTIPADVQGHKLGVLCSVCADDINMDKAVGYQGNPYGNPYPWVIHDASSVPGATTTFDLNKYVTILESEPDHAKIYVKPDAPLSTDDCSYGGVIQAMSILSTQNVAGGRTYDSWVPGAVSIKIVKGNDDAEPYGGSLKYGEQTLDESIREGLSTDHPKYATAIRVVDNSGKQPDRVLVYFTIGGGANYRICPDLFDLDLNGSYTFYMQAIDPVSAENRERYEKHEIGNVIEDDAAAIREEYFSHLSASRPYGYVGTKYPHGKVFYAKLDRPKITLNYKGVDYKGKNVTYDPVNIYSVGKGSGIIGEIKPTAYESIESNNGMEGMVYSLYEGAGSSQSGWKKWYYFDDSAMEYQGDKKLGGNVVEVSPGGNPYMKLDGDDRLEACGNYHIVPGMIYQNKKYDHYEIIGWQGFDYPNLPREKRYYEFDESTVHVNVNADFTMEINHEKFKGKVAFPLPKEMKNSPLFPNIESLDWQTSAGGLTVAALPDGWTSGYDMTFSYVCYRYIKNDNAWEVEPVTEEYDTGAKKIRVYTYGRYKCRANETKWTWLQSVATTERDLVCNLEGLVIDNTSWKMYFPLPSESSFPFRGSTTKIDCNSSHVVFDEAGNAKSDLLMYKARIKYEHVGNIHRIIFVNMYSEGQEFGAFECTDGGTRWTKIR